MIAWMGLLEGEAGLRVVREALEGVIEPSTVSALLFEALELDGKDELPRSSEELLEFVRGPLGIVLSRRLGGSSAGELVTRLETTFDRIVRGLPMRDGAGTTMEVPVGGGPVRVLVISRSSALAARLRASLGGVRTAVAHAVSAEAARREAAAGPVDVAVVDAIDAAGDLDPLLDVIGALPATTTRILWGEEQPFGQRIKRAAATRRVPLTTVERAEGMAPVIDLVRARQG